MKMQDGFGFTTMPDINRTYNVLLLALSVFPGKKTEKVDLSKRETTYSYSDPSVKEDIIVSGCYQLEPIPKMLAKKLDGEGQKLDAIIMLCTKETEEVRFISHSDYSFPDPVSPKTYFEVVMDSYVATGFPEQERFFPVSYDPGNPASGINETVRLLRNLRATYPGLHLYMDTHGGFRGVQLVLEAIISLLKVESIVPEVYSINYDENKTIVPILKGDNEFRIFDFVSGINELNNNARANSLREYIKVDENSRAQKLVKALDTVSDGIRLCDITKFETGIRDLSKELHKDVPYKNAYLNLFIDNIRSQYEDLIKENCTTIDYIKWCLDKGYFQQAITLIEARMPALLFKSGILTIEESKFDWFLGELDGYKKDMPYTILLNNMSASLKSDYELNQRMDSLAIIKGYSLDGVSNLEKLTSKIKGRNQNDGKLIDYDFSSPILTSGSNTTALTNFLRLHWAFHELRNSLNHAGNSLGNYQIEHIQSALERYVSLYREIESQVKAISEAKQ